MLVGKGAVYTANAPFWMKYRTASGALIVDDSGIRRHFLRFGKPAMRAGDDRVQVDIQMGITTSF